MKLHLPKPLRNSVLACIAAVAGIATPTLGTATFAGGVVAFTLASQQAMAATYLEANDSLYYIGGTTQDNLNSETITGVTVETPEGGKRTTIIEEIDASGMTTVNIAADSNQNVWTNAGIGLLKAQSGATIDVKVSGWDGNRYFDALLIEELEVAESGTVNINVSKAEHTVVLNSLDGTLGTAALTGTLTIGFDASFATANSVSGTGTLSVVNGATATINTTGGTSGVTSNVQVGAGSKLVLAQGDALGWGNSSTKSITLIGTGTDEAGQAKLEMSGKQTMTTNLNLSGNGLVTGGQLEFFGGRITATGTNNVIASDIYCRGGQNGIIAVTGETDILEITGTVKKGSQGEGPITKEGEGKLILSGADNIFYQDFAVKGGTVTLSNTTTMNGSLTLHDGATLETTVDSAITFGSNFKIDVSNLTAIAGEGNVMKYTILTGSGNKSLETLNAGNISGIITMGKIWTFGSDGSVSYVVTTKDLVWDGTSGSVETWSTSDTQFSSGGEFANGDNVTFAASASVSVAQGGVQALNMIVQGEGTHVRLLTAEGITLGEGLTVKDGAILELATSSNEVGVLRGVVTVEDGGTLRFSAKDVTGWGGSGNTTHTINVLAGGTLEMAHANNETFRGTLNLDGSMKGTAASASLWDLFGGKATVNVSAGATAKMENMSLNLRQDNSVVTVGEGGSLTIEKGIKKGDAGNAVVIKEGAGALIVQGESTNSGFTVNGGSVEMANANDLTMSISGVAGTSFTKNGAGIINMGNIKDYSYAGEMIVNDGEIKFTSDDGEQGANQPGVVRLYNNLVTAEGTKAVVEGNVSINYRAEDAQSCTSSLNGNLEITGGMQLNSFGSGNSPDGDSMRRWNIESDGTLTVGGALWLTNKQKMVVSGGDLVAAGGIILGHGDNGAGGAYKAKLQLDSGSVTTSGIEFKGGHNSVVMNGGTLEFTSAEAFTGGADNNSNQINLLGGTIKVSASDVTLAGSAQHNLTMGGIDIDVASGKTATLGGTISLSSTIEKTGSGTLKLDNGVVLSVDDFGAFDRGEESTYTDFNGSTTSGNGFFSGSILLIAGDYNKAGSITVQVGGTAVTNYVEDSTGLGVSVTDNSTYFVNTGTVTLTESKSVSEFYIASGAVLAYEAGDFTDVVITGSGVYDIGSNYETANRTGVTNADAWTGTVRISNATVGGDKFSFNNYGNVNSALELVGVSGWLPQNSNMAARLLLGKDTEAGLNGINVTAASNWTHTFSGGVAGEGDFLVSRTGDGNPDYVFRGDMSGWTGAFRVDNESGNQEVIMKVENTGVVTTVNAGVECIRGNLTLEVAGSNGKAVFNKAVNATTLKINGHGEFTKDVTLSGDLKLTADTNNHVVFHGTNNIVNVIDLSNGNAAAGILELKKDAKLTSRNTLWMRPDASILLEEDASVIWKESMVTGKTGTKAEIITSQDASQELHQSYLTIKNADCTVSGSASRTVAALLQNSSVINASTGLVTVTNAANTLTGVEAKAGNILVQNATTGSLVGLGAITAADDLSVSADVASAQVSAITLGTDATFSTTGALTVADGSALSLGAGAGISLDGALTLGSGLVLTVSDVSKDTILFSGVTSIATSLDDITAYISSINGLADLTDYTLSLEDGNLVLVVDKGKIVTWDAANTTWKDSAQFGATAEDADVFINGDMVVFGNLAADEAVTIEGGVHAVDMVVDATAGKTYTFTAAADGGTLTVPTLSINSGKAVFGANTIQLDSLAAVTVGNNGELDLSAYAAGTTLEKMLGIASGGGLIKLAGGEIVSGGAGDGDENRLRLQIMASATQTVMDYEIDGSLAMNGWNQGDKLLTIATDFAVAEELRLESAAKVTVAAGGHLITDKGNTSDTDCISLGYMNDDSGVVLAMTGGKITTGTIKITQGGTHEFRMDGGTLEITSNAGIASGVSTTITGGTLVADTASWGITGATIGGATVTDGTLNCAVQIQTAGLDTEGADDDTSITLTNATLTGTLDNAAGKLVLAGAVTINGSGFNKQETLDDFSNGGTDGFATTDTYYQLVTTAGNLSIADGTTWTMGEYVATGDKAGWVRVDGTQYGDIYYLNTADISTTLSAIKLHAGTTYTLSSIALNGGNLEYDVTDAAVAINVQESGVIKITDADTTDTTEVVLSSSKVTGTGSATLTGNGVYDLGTVTNLGTDITVPNALKVTLSQEWTGTVRLTGSVANIALSDLGNDSSTIQLAGVSGYLKTEQNKTYSSNLLLSDGGFTFTEKNGYTYTLSGAITGDGNLSVVSSGNGAMVLNLTGNLSAWEGGFVVAQHATSTNTQDITLNLTGGGNLFASSGKGIEMNRGGKMYVTIGNADKATTMNAAIANIGTGTLNLTTVGTTTLQKNVAVSSLSNSGILTVNGTLAAGAAVTNNGTLSLTQDAATLGSLAGTGTVTAESLTLTGAATGSNGITADSLTLQAATNTVGALTLDTLTLGVAAVKTADGVITTAGVASTLVTTGQLSVTGDVNVLTLGAGITETSGDVTTSYGMLKAAGLAGKLNFVIAEDELTRYMGTSNTLTLATITGLTTTDVSLNKVAGNTQWSDTDHAWTDSEGQYTYILEVDNGVLTLTRENLGIIWNGASDEKWVMDIDDATDDEVADTKAWTDKSGDADLAYTGAESVIFDGRGITGVIISGDVETKNVNINAEGKTYTFTGDAAKDGLDTLEIQNKLSVLKGTLKADAGLDVSATHSVEVLNGAAMELLSGASVHALAGISNAGTVTIGASSETQGAAALFVEYEGSVNNSGTMVVNGILQAGYGMGVAAKGLNINNSGTLTNAGMIKADGNLDNSGTYTQTAGSLTVYGNVLNTGSVTETTPAGGMNITDGYAVVGGNLTNSGAMSISGGAQTRPGEDDENVDCVNLEVGGTLTNTSTLAVSGKGTSVTAGQLANSGAVTIDAAELQVLGQPVLTYSNVVVTDPVTGEVVTESAWEVKYDPETGAPMYDENGDFVMEEIQVPVTEWRGAIADGTVAASYSNDGGVLNITNGGQLVVSAITDDFDGYLAGMVTNAGGTINISGALVQQLDAAGKPVLDDAGKPVMVPNTGMLVEGDLNNTEGTIQIGSTETDSAAATYGSLTVTGDLINTKGNLTIAGEGSSASIGGDLKMVEVTGEGENETIANAGNLTVGKGASLSVGGDLVANQMELGFEGSVAVGGTATLKDLTIAEGATFTAENATITGVLDNDGSLTVTTTEVKDENGNPVLDKDNNKTYTGGQLSIGTLTGAGVVHVAEGGTLSIGSSVNFTGTLTGEGKLTTGNQAFTLLTKQDEVTDVAFATDISAKSLVVAGQWMKDGKVVEEGTPGAKWASANGSILGEVAADSITFTKLDTTGNKHLTMESLQAYSTSTASGVTQVEVALSQLDTVEGVAELIKTGVHTYNLLSYVDGKVNFSLADMAYDREQQLWKSGLKLGELTSVTTMALRDAGTNVSISVLKQSLADATWNTAGETTGIGLDLGTLTNGTMVLKGNDMLDNVQSVNVTKDVTLDLSSNDTNAVNVNGLTGGKTLNIAGNGDVVNVSTLDGGFGGTLGLDNVQATVSGMLDTVKLTNKTVADLAVTNTDVEALTSGLTLNGSMKGGELSISKAVGVKGTLKIDGTDLNIAYDDGYNGSGRLSMAITNTSDTGHVLVHMSQTTGEAGDIFIGKGDEASKLMEKYFTNVRFEDNKGVVADRNTVYYTSKLADKGTSDNGKAGLAMADEVLLSVNPQGDSVTGDLDAVLDQLDEYVAKGNKAAADELGASLAGASTAVLGMAAMGDVDRQLRAIRNRTTTMGVDQSVVNADMPYFNAWINAEGDSREMGEDETLGGYKLNSYGGTVGFDVDIEPTLTAGMALTAMYGDLDATGADQATGNLDSYYVSAFARYCGSAWTHTFVGTIGMGDISLDRTVAGAQVKGETDSMSFGLMYEVGRVYAMDEDGTTCLQPVFNVTWKHTTVDAYTEKGGDVALSVDEQSLDTITFGLGARLQTVVGESMYNRTSIFECRLLAKADAGDTEGTSKVALGSSATHEVKSNEMGAIGIEVGAGLTIPLGDEGSSIFMDASAEIRADYTDVNGTVGYRVNF